MKLEDMSDFELNAELSARLLLNSDNGFEKVTIIDDLIVGTHKLKGEFLKKPRDYCNDWSATMPLAVEYVVSLAPTMNTQGDKKYDGEWCAYEHFLGIYAHDESPLRAIVICLIKLLDAKNG